MLAFLRSAPFSINNGFKISAWPSQISNIRPFHPLTQDQSVIPTTIVSSTRRRIPAVARPIVPSQALHELFNVEDKAQSRGEILKSIAVYVKENNLQDPSDRRKFQCDDKLKAVLGVDQCTLIKISKFIQPHLLKPLDLGGDYVQQAIEYEQDYLKRKSDEKKEKKKIDSNAAKRKRTVHFKPVLLSDELAAVCNARELTRPVIIKRLWKYIRERSLYDGSSKTIKCDVLLKNIFHTDKLLITEIMKGVSPHVTKKD